MSFSEDSDNVSDWVTHSPLNQPQQGGYRDTVIPLGQSGPVLGWGGTVIPKHWDCAQGRVSPQECREVGKDAQKQPATVCSLLPFLLVSFFLTFFLSLPRGKFCARSGGYRLENMFPALEALRGWSGSEMKAIILATDEC